MNQEAYDGDWILWDKEVRFCFATKPFTPTLRCCLTQCSRSAGSFLTVVIFDSPQQGYSVFFCLEHWWLRLHCFCIYQSEMCSD